MQIKKEETGTRFGEVAREYVKSVTHAKGDDLKRLVEMAQPNADWEALDIATGGGHTALTFAPHVKCVTASDISPKMLDAASDFITKEKGFNNVSFKEADSENLPFEADTFDLVTCRIAPHHFPDCQAFIHEAFRVAKSSGCFLMQDHVLPEESEIGEKVDAFERLRDPSHVRAYSKSGWIELFKTAGFSIRATDEVVKRHNLKAWAERQRCTDETIETLFQMINQADPIMSQWLQPENMDSEEASFVNHHLLIAGIKE